MVAVTSPFGGGKTSVSELLKKKGAQKDLDLKDVIDSLIFLCGQFFQVIMIKFQL